MHDTNPIERLTTEYGEIALFENNDPHPIGFYKVINPITIIASKIENDEFDLRVFFSREDAEQWLIAKLIHRNQSTH